MQQYRYRDSITREIEYVESISPPVLSLSGNAIQANTVTFIKKVESSGGIGILSFIVNLTGNAWSTVSNTIPLGTYNISVKKQTPINEAPTGTFNLNKISSAIDANINEFNNIQSSITNEKIELRWLANDVNLLCRKIDPLLLNSNTFNGNYIVNLV